MRTLRMGLCVWFVATLGLAGQAEWTHWRGPNHDGKSPDTGLLKQWPDGGPERLWSIDSIGKGFSTVSVSNGTVYTTGDKDGKLMVFALGLDGKGKWSKAIDKDWTRSHPGSRATPTIDGGNLYILSGNGVIACLDAASGAKKWASSTRDFGGRSGGWGYAESVLIYKNLAICKPGGSNCIVALDKATGRKVWTSSGFNAGPEYSSCVPVTIGKGHVLLTGTRAGLVCVNARNGEMLWEDSWSANNTANCPDPAYADGHVFWANGYGKGGVCVKMGVSDGRLVAKRAWTTKDMVCHHGGYIIQDGYIYGNNGGGWACLELKTGKRMWNERGVGKGSLCWADGMLYLFGERGGKAGLATCSPDGMEMKGEFSVAGSGPSWAHPVVIGGRLYLRYDTNLYCYDVKAK